MSTKKALHAGWIIPVRPKGQILEKHTLVIEDQKIKSILPTEDWKRRKKSRNMEELDLNSCALIPGFVNTHTHSPMSLLRGVAEDLPFDEWLKNHIWPLEDAFVNKEFVRDGTELSIAEMLLSGTTCFNDMYFFGDETARISIETGIRACIGMIVIKFPSKWASSVDEYFQKGQKIHDDFRNHPLISCAFAPHAPYSIDDQSLARISTLAEELDVQIHMHIQETKEEILQSLEEFGCSPIRRLEKLGLLSSRLTGVHLTEVSEEEINLIAQSGINVAHCPKSNLKLGCGIAPILAMEQKGLNIALGTDGAASNNELDMLGEAKMASLLAKGSNRSATVLPAETCLEMATLNGARALGLEDEIGSLEVGKTADIVAIEMGRIDNLPVYNPLVQILYSGNKTQIANVWVSGRQLVKNRRLLTIDEDRLVEKSEKWKKRISDFNQSRSS